jgi:hypothetical protein
MRLTSLRAKVYLHAENALVACESYEFSPGSSRAGFGVGCPGCDLIFGMLGMAVDGGRAMINRRALQSAADSASDSAMRMILQDYHDQTASRPLSFSDCNIATRVKEIATAANTSALGSGIDDGTGQCFADTPVSRRRHQPKPL